MSGGGIAARRYARALLDVARDQDAMAVVHIDLARLAQLLTEHKPLRALLQNPAIDASVKKKIAVGLRAAVEWSDLSQRLLEMLLERQRTELIPAIEDAYTEMWNASRGVIQAEVVSAQPLDETQMRALSAAIKRATGDDAEILTETDPELLGGLLVRMQGRTYDGSVRTQLRALRRQLTQGRPA